MRLNKALVDSTIVPQYCDITSRAPLFLAVARVTRTFPRRKQMQCLVALQPDEAIVNYRLVQTNSHERGARKGRGVSEMKTPGGDPGV